MLIDRLLGDREFPPELPPTLCYHVGVVDVNGTVKSIGTSWACEEEAQAVIQLVRALVQGGYDRTHITVLCFYDAQRALLRRLLRAAGFSEIPVYTIEKAQGQENRVIIMSNVQFTLFTEDRRRVNMAITRAQTSLIIMTNVEKMRASKEYSDPAYTDMLKT